jgi:uncharacterized CHY-type Zn-finger protein
VTDERDESDGDEGDEHATVMVDATQVRGIDVDRETRCAHYDAAVDVLALAFPCCETFYPCFECHEAVTDHDAERWPRTDFDREAVICGRCGRRLTIGSYLDCDDVCPECDGAFNPGCRKHYHQYFAVDEENTEPENDSAG